MKIEKNKIVFASVLIVIVLFLIAYSLLVFGKKDDSQENLRQTSLPQLEEQKEYDSKLDAIDALKKVRETNAPSIYDERLLDSLGYFDALLMEKEKERLIDSVINLRQNRYPDFEESFEFDETYPQEITEYGSAPVLEEDIEPAIAIKEKEIAHHLFFASHSTEPQQSQAAKATNFIPAVVDGDQTVKVNSRLQMRTTEDAFINDQFIPKNTAIYGFVKFQPNRVMIKIEHLLDFPVTLKAFDLQDGNEGIYIENNFSSEVEREAYDNVLNEINIPAVPQVGRFSNLFRRNNRNIKVVVTDNYRLLLKTE